MIAAAASPTPVQPSLAAYTLDASQDWDALLAPFSPPLEREGEVILASLFGDVFLVAPDGAVVWVRAQMGEVDAVADTRADFEARIGGEHVAFLKTPLVDALKRQDMVLRPGQVYGLKQPPAEGGRWHPENIGAAPIDEAFAWWGEMFRRARALASATAPALIRGGVRPERQMKKKGWFS